MHNTTPLQDPAPGMGADIAIPRVPSADKATSLRRGESGRRGGSGGTWAKCLKQPVLGSWIMVFAMSLSLSARGQDARCGEPGFQYLGQLSYSTNADSGSDTKTTALKPGFIPDAGYQQASIKAAGGGSGAVSDLSPEDIPKGFKLIMSGSESSCKSWAVLRPLKLTVEELDGATVKQFGFSAKMYCTRGSTEACKTAGGCEAKVEICGRPAPEPKPASDKKTGLQGTKTRGGK